jgi:hypothetical protein
MGGVFFEGAPNPPAQGRERGWFQWIRVETAAVPTGTVTDPEHGITQANYPPRVN